MTLTEVRHHWNEIDIPKAVIGAVEPFRDPRRLRKLGDPAGAWRGFAAAARDWLCDPTSHVCVACGQQVVADRCHAFPQAGLERIRDFETRREDHVVGHTFDRLLSSRVRGMGGDGSPEQLACQERTINNIENLMTSEAPKALRCRIGDTFVAPLLCQRHERQFSNWERACYSGIEGDFWAALPPDAMFCFAYRAALRQLYQQECFVRVLGMAAGDELRAHWNRTAACLEDAHGTFIAMMNGRMPSISGLQMGRAVYAGLSETLLPFAGSGTFTYPRSLTRPEESYIGLVVPVELNAGSRTLILLWQTAGKSSDLALDMVRTWTMSRRRGRDELVGFFFGVADQIFMSPKWWRRVPERVRIRVTERIHNRGPTRAEERAIAFEDTVADLGGLWYFKHGRFYSARYTDIRRGPRGVG